MARLSRALADAGVNIYGHLFLGRWGDRAMFAFVVDDPTRPARSSSASSSFRFLGSSATASDRARQDLLRPRRVGGHERDDRVVALHPGDQQRLDVDASIGQPARRPRQQPG